LRKSEKKDAANMLFINFKKAYDSVKTEVLYNILIAFSTPLIKMCLNETSSKVRVGKSFSDMFPVRKGFKQGDALSPLIFNFSVEFTIRKVRVIQDGLKLNGTH
jgi:hypothetical protein